MLYPIDFPSNQIKAYGSLIGSDNEGPTDLPGVQPIH